MKNALSLILLVGCSRTPATPTSPSIGTNAASPSGQLEQGMANCPSAVAGASTELAMTETGVDLVITAKDPDARRQIQSLAERHMRMGDPAGLPEHSGLHGGPGSMGFCPIIHDATTVTATGTEAGATVHVRADEASKVGALQEETRSRVAGLRAHTTR
jgi:hypothetical protein